MVRLYNKHMEGTDLWDKLEMALHYSLEMISHCPKWDVHKALVNNTFDTIVICNPKNI